MIVRRRGFMSGSPPPARAATVSSLMRRVKILPRLASRAPFLCLIEAHLEWPDMCKTPANQRDRTENLTLFFARMIHTSARSSQGGRDSRRARARREPGPLEPRVICWTGSVRNVSSKRCSVDRAAAPFDVALLEGRQTAARDPGGPIRSASGGRRRAARPRSWTRFVYSRQLRHVGHEIEAEESARLEHARDRRRASR